MANRILHDRLQNKIRHFRIESLGSDVHARHQTVPKTDAFDFEVTTEKLHLLLQCYLLGAGILQGEPKKIPQSGDHFAGGLGVFVK